MPPRAGVYVLTMVGCVDVPSDLSTPPATSAAQVGDVEVTEREAPRALAPPRGTFLRAVESEPAASALDVVGLTFVPSPALDGPAQAALERLQDVRADPPGQLRRWEAQLAAEIAASPGACPPEPGLLDGLRHARPMPPLAPDGVLSSASDDHARDMAQRGFFDHVDPDGVGPNERLRARGVRLTRTVSSGGRTYHYAIGPGSNQVEALARQHRAGNGPLAPPNADRFGEAIDGLIVDRCVPSLGHRKHLLGLTPLAAAARRVGIGWHEEQEVGAPRWSRTLHVVVTTILPDDDELAVVGVVYDDLDGDRSYDLGEGIAGEPVAIPTSGRYTRTAEGGGFAIRLPAGGSYEIVTASGRAAFTLQTENARVAVRRGEPPQVSSR